MSATPIEQNARVHELIRQLDEAMTPRDDAGRCRNVKRILEETFAAGTEFLEDKYLVPNPERYARRLVHRDPQNRYTVIAMVWNTGQGTPLHDHAGMWCVECVYRGRIRVTSFDLESSPRAEVLTFTPESVVLAGKGEAGHLIPPFEYHMIENPDETAAVTIHVYGGEMTSCTAFFPLEEGGYRREVRPLRYTS